MENYPNLPSYVEVAAYNEQRIPHFKNNAFIAALPPSLNDEKLEDFLFDLPKFEVCQRSWENYERLYMVDSLANFLLPLSRHVQLARAIDSLIRNGYVGRAPGDIKRIQIFNDLYHAQRERKNFAINSGQFQPHLSRSIIGPSGMGKTSTVKRVCAQYQRCIYHPNFDIFQVPCIHIEAPHDGISVKGLANSIILEMDKLIPDGDYFEKYVKKQRNVDATLVLIHCARVMHLHGVGLLIVDEVQNIKNAGIGNQRLMSALVTASNTLGVPILMIGTNKAKTILGLDFRQGRRSIGPGFQYMGPLERSGSFKKPGEWEDFLSILWKFQWIRKPVELNEKLSNLMYHYCQGIIDVAIKLFACVQWRAILDGTETITAQVMDLCANNELAIILPMMEACRKGDTEALNNYGDIAPISFDELRNKALYQYEGQRNKKAAISREDSRFVPTITDALVTLGVDAVRAEEIATSVQSNSEARNVVEGTKLAIDIMRPPRRSKVRKKDRQHTLADFGPADLRNAISKAKKNETTIFKELCAMNAVCDLEKNLEL